MWPSYTARLKNAAPPYQSVVYFPAAAFVQPSSENISEMSELMFIPQSGRALLYPVLKGTYERRFDERRRVLEEYVWMTRDILRTVDYIVAGDEFDADRISYMGLSFGAEFVAPLALDKRFRTAVLIGGALDPAWVGVVPEAAAPWNFVARVTTPTLVANGRYDFMHPYEEGQLPFFEALNVPTEDKRFVVFEAGHLPPNNDVVRETLRWWDERLGRVTPSRSP